MCLLDKEKRNSHRHLWLSYSVSEDGEVLDNSVGWGVKSPKPQHLTKGGYKYLTLRNKDGIRKGFFVHRLVAMAFIPNPENKKEVDHINGVKTDNRVENLRWVTRSENQKHCVKINNISFKGSDHPQSKLLEKDVLGIRELRLKTKKTYREIAKIYGVSLGCVDGIISGRTWSHI